MDSSKPPSLFAVRITPPEIDQALRKVETGESTVEHANLLRNFIRGLLSRLNAYEMGDDDTRVDIYVE